METGYVPPAAAAEETIFSVLPEGFSSPPAGSVPLKWFSEFCTAADVDGERMISVCPYLQTQLLCVEVGQESSRNYPTSPCPGEVGQ